MIISSKTLISILAGVGLLLMIPFIAMQFSPEVNWSLSDFIIMGILLTLTGIGIAVTVKKVRSTQVRYFLVIGILLLFLLVWAELAVGIFGTPFAGS